MILEKKSSKSQRKLVPVDGTKKKSKKSGRGLGYSNPVRRRKRLMRGTREIMKMIILVLVDESFKTWCHELSVWEGS